MTVAELIEKLEAMPPKAEAWMDSKYCEIGHNLELILTVQLDNDGDVVIR